MAVAVCEDSILLKLLTGDGKRKRFTTEEKHVKYQAALFK